jgi:hypothetical protein
MIPPIIKEVAWSFHPYRYNFISGFTFRRSIKYLAQIIFIALLLSLVLASPKFFTLRASIDDAVSQFSVFNLTGNVSTSGEVTIPSKDPFLVIDLQSPRNISDETFLITKDKIDYRFFGRKTVSINALIDPKNTQAESTKLMSTLALMLIPGVIFYSFIYTFLKYFLLVLLMPSVLFVLLEVSKFKLRWRELANISAHAATIPVFLEILSEPFSSAYLIPTIKFLGSDVYVVTVALAFVLTVVGVVFVHLDRSGIKPKFKRKKKR